MSELMNALVKSAEAKVNYLCDMELDMPATWDSENLDQIKDEVSKEIEGPLNSESLSRFNDADEDDIDEILSKLHAVGIEATRELLPSIVPNLFDSKVRNVFELSVAYYRVAQIRYCDNIPLVIYHSLVLELSKATEDYLIEKLGILSDNFEYIETLMSDSQAIVLKRSECEDRLKRLREVQKSIYS